MALFRKTSSTTYLDSKEKIERAFNLDFVTTRAKLQAIRRKMRNTIFKEKERRTKKVLIRFLKLYLVMCFFVSSKTAFEST